MSKTIRFTKGTHNDLRKAKRAADLTRRSRTHVRQSKISVPDTAIRLTRIP